MGVRLTDRLPHWLHEWLGIVVPGGQILLILLAAWLLRLLGRRLLDRVGRRYTLPPEAVVGARRVMTFLIYAAALLMALERLGVSGTVLWTAFTGFAAVGAVAFFAAWSVLSNIFCTMLILTTRPFRLYDHVELLENGEKPGLRGQVVDINLVYTTLRETDDGDGAGTVLQVPNSLFFQRALRRWRGGALPEPKGAGAKRGDPLDV
ncbi:mechanosensitive ion channel family protein [Luteimonas sp. TWI1416]|uniref:mechanosensitive ion channel family protein n=1 Tax=unclassified Luteimonas TaxID=2629088 RepID=UPI00320B96A0